MTDAQPTPIIDQLNALATIDSSYDRRKVIDFATAGKATTTCSNNEELIEFSQEL